MVQRTKTSTSEFKSSRKGENVREKRVGRNWARLSKGAQGRRLTDGGYHSPSEGKRGKGQERQDNKCPKVVNKQP